ncbi:alpha/beta hydrolase [Candidatus Gracilibacteria bacterium]|nr:alpha/beta hydrolase [Candidatus Gracilibacteria bacterium]
MPIDLDTHRVIVRTAGTHPVELSVIDVGPLNPPGRGTIVCVHGAAGRAVQWQKQVDALAPNYRVIAPDLRGHGRSQVPDSAYSLEEFLWDLTQVLSVLQVAEPFVMMAHSFGGPIAMTFVAANAARVSKLVLIATGPRMKLQPLQEALFKAPLPLRYLEFLRPILYPKTYAPTMVIQRVLAGTLFRWDGYAILPQISVPTLLIAGHRDALVPPEQVEAMQRQIPNIRVDTVRYTGHLVHLERPDAVNRHIDRFLVGPRSWRDTDAIPIVGDNPVDKS